MEKKSSAHVGGTGSVSTMTIKHHHHHSPRRRRRRQKKAAGEKNPFDIPGVYKVVLTAESQHFLGCNVGDEITTEKPWITIKKELLEEDIERFEAESAFNPLKVAITNFTNTDVLIGYITNLEKEEDEFYVCLTQEATDTVNEIVAKMQEEQQARLNNSVEKEVKDWTSLGSENEVNEDVNKNNRPLLEVEIESKYPIITEKVRFKYRFVKDVRDGYIELLTNAKTISNIIKRCIHASVQVTPIMKHNFAQTTCAYPKNAWTQYEYEYVIDENPRAQFKESISQFLINRMDTLDEDLRINSHINFYTDDYVNLVKNDFFARTPILVHVKEHMSFTDIDLCKNKMVSSVAWHHMWCGIVVLSYVDMAPSAYVTETPHDDEVNRIVYGVNPVLLWSFNDALHAKLYLQAHREVTIISCCPFDENLIVAGLTNGQLIIWDIRNKLNKVEEEEVLTVAQQKYRKLMFSMIGWMTNTSNISQCRATVISNLQYSHTAPVTNIQWISPQHEITKMGLIREVPKNSPHPTSLQFATSSLDGSILFWDLLAKPQFTPGDYRPAKKLRRLAKRPSALCIDVSPFRVLHRLLKPHFKINFVNTGAIIHPITFFQLSHIEIHWNEEITQARRRSTDRAKYMPSVSIDPVERHVVAGTSGGDIIFGTWEGFEYSSGDVINQETCKHTFMARYHDGPLVSVHRFPPKSEIVLSVGGKIFALWMLSFPHKPILWRKSRYNYTHGNWAKRNITMIRLTRADGNIELWNLTIKSDQFLAEQSLSGKYLTGAFSQPMAPSKPVVGVADHNGSFRMYIFPSSLMQCTEHLNNILVNYLKMEIKRKINIANWQKDWNDKYATWIKMKKDALLLEQKLKDDAIKAAQQKMEEERERLEIELAKKNLKESIPPGEYKKYVEEQWLEREKARMNNVLLSLRQLNPELVISQQIPLKKIEKEQEAKKKKQRKRLQRADHIFRDTVAMLFPNALQKTPPPPLDPYAGGDPPEARDACFHNFNNLTKDATKYIKDHPFYYEFDWNTVIKQGYERREMLDRPYGISKHRMRYYTQQNFLEDERRRALDEEIRRRKGIKSQMILEDEEGEEEEDVVDEEPEG